MIKFIIDWIDLFLFRRQWRKHNSHNETVPVRKFDIHKVIVGKYTYGLLDVSDWSTNGRLTIGSYCSISPHVIFLMGSEHPTWYISTFPFKAKMFRQPWEAINKGEIVIKDDVWLGMNSIICSGVTIEQGAVIATGSVVTNNVPPYAIVGGVPARIIKYRFSAKVVERLAGTDLEKLFANISRADESALYTRLTDHNVDTILSQIMGQ